MQEDIKKEDSDSDVDGPPMNISDELKDEVKSKFGFWVTEWSF